MTVPAERVILICPDGRPGLDFLSAEGPLALAAFLGKPLLDHALDGLARRGVREVLLLLSSWPEEIRRFAESGHIWGLKLILATESAELSPEAAAEKHRAFGAEEVLTLDCLPQAPEVNLLSSPAAWHAGRAALLPLLAPSMVGTREISPGVWLGLRAQVDSSAVLTAPCWIGMAARIGRRARVRGFVEEGSVVDHDAVVEDSTVGPGTCLGEMTLLRESLAMGNQLLNWRNGSLTRLTDAFLLAPLSPVKTPSASWPARLAALAALLLTWPVVLPALFRGGPLFVRKSALRGGSTPAAALAAVIPPGSGGNGGAPTVDYREIAAYRNLWRRWPMLWNVLRGEFAWTGNPPLSPEEAAMLHGEFELRWLSAPTGIFTAPEAEGSQAPWDDTAKAHAALFAGRADAAWRRRILAQGLQALLLRPRSPAAETASAPF